MTTKKTVTIVDKLNNLKLDTSALDAYRNGARWAVLNVLPLISVVLLAGLAVVGGMNVLGHISHDAKLLVSIAVVAIFTALASSK